jgi:hypothetical protein
MSLLTISELRTRVGLLATDLTKDAELTQCYSIALAIVEDYLDRKILRGVYTERFFDVRYNALLKAWPVVSIDTIDGNAPPTDLVVDKALGVIRNVNWSNAEVAYTGGWLDADIPMAITLAISQVFDAIWFATPGFGLVKASAVASGTVKKFSINGVSVEYVDPTSTSSSSSGNSASDTGFITVMMKGFLDPYRRESVVGAG